MNALLLGSLLYRSGLVQPLLFASDLAAMFGFWSQGSLPAGTAVVPIAL